MPPEPTRSADCDAVIRRRLAAEPLLAKYETALRRRLLALDALRDKLASGSGSLRQFASGHQRLGLHRDKKGWVLREWAPGATAIFFKGPFSEWRALPEFALRRSKQAPDVWELRLDADALAHGTAHRLEVHWRGGRGDRLPAYARRVEQDAATRSWNAKIWQPARSYRWRHRAPAALEGPLLIYETHIGMAQEEPRTGTYAEFRTEVLPRIRDAGYNALQVMGLAEHVYYGSFGYQVSNFFASSSRFGTPDELCELIDAAHGMGLRVLMDMVHSHCARNEVEGISRQDGSDNQYVHAGERGEHPAWGSRCFDYTDPEVLRFLLSNCRYWLDEFKVDGFRFDGITSMLYSHHGLEHVFTGFSEFYDDKVDEDALAYLALANELIHELRPDAITIAEDVSGMPGLALPTAEGGAGFDYRFAMGIADQWIKLVKETKDERWPLAHLWYELTNRRYDEKTISYAESHDQALVGDQTLIFRLLGERMYDKMSILTPDLGVARGIALHKLIRLLTLATAGHGYLNFMGNEFGHPEWIDFPREGNEWSHDHARRQWSLAANELLRYRHLQAFDRALVQLARAHGFPGSDEQFLVHVDADRKLLVWVRADLLFVVNLHPERSFADQPIPAAPGDYRIVLDSDQIEFGGHGRQDPTFRHRTQTDRIERHFLHLYLPSRTALVLQQVANEDVV